MQAKKFKPKRQQSQSTMRRDALRRLKERWMEDNDGEEWEPEKEPVVSPMFKAVDGGIGHVLEALRAHEEDDARAFIETYERCSATDVRHLPLEYIAFAAGIGSLRLAELAQTAIFLYDGMKTKMLLASGLPSIVSRSIQMAKTPKGVYDREMMLKAGGVLPVPKGAQIAIQNVYGDKEEAPVAAPAWRQPEDLLREIHDATEPKRLPSPAGAPINIGGQLDHMQEETIHIVRGD